VVRRVAAVLAAGVALTACTSCTGGEGTAGPPTSSTTARVAETGTTSTTIDSRAVVPTDVFLVAPRSAAPVSAGGSHIYTAEVEQGIPVDPATFAAAVEAVLTDPRGWAAAGDVNLQRVGPEAVPTFRVRLATPATTDAHCAPLDTHAELSCRNGADVMINLTRWLEGAAASGLTREQYRQYLISHEVGHALGHEHVECPGPGQLAPVMLQQTLGLGGCAPNPWPFP
jgi:hypothetical protein